MKVLPDEPVLEGDHAAEYEVHLMAGKLALRHSVAAMAYSVAELPDVVRAPAV